MFLDRHWRKLRAACLGALLAAIASGAAAAAPDTLLPELERRLAAGGADQVNAYLAANWSTAMLPLSRRAAACEPRAVNLAVRLSRSRNVRTVPVHVDAIREAVGRCTAAVLALATRAEVPMYCSSVPSWTVMQTVRELRRRIAAIEADEALRASPMGKSCRAAYLHELHNTRVQVRSAPPPSRRG